MLLFMFFYVFCPSPKVQRSSGGFGHKSGHVCFFERLWCGDGNVKSVTLCQFWEKDGEKRRVKPGAWWGRPWSASCPPSPPATQTSSTTRSFTRTPTLSSSSPPPTSRWWARSLIARPKKNLRSVYIRFDHHHDHQEYLFLQLMQLLTGCVHRVLELQNVLVSFFPLSDISLSFQQKHAQTKFPA